MNKFFKKAFLFLLCSLAGFRNISKLNAQATVDSPQNKIITLPKNADAARISEGAMQLQTIFFSDSLFRFTQQLLTTVEKIYGKDHPYYASGLAALAILYMHKGDYEKAMSMFQQSIAIMKVASQENTLPYSGIVSSLSQLYERMGQYEKALSLCQQTLAIRKKILKEGDPLYPLYYPLSLNNMASLYMHMGFYEKALPLFKEALEIRKKTLGKQHPYIAISLNSLGQFYTSIKKYQKALPLFNEALEIGKAKFGEGDIEYMTALDNLAKLYADMGMHRKALPLHKQLMEWRKKTLGEEHPDYANSLYALGSLNSVANHPLDASGLFIKGNDIVLKHLSRTYSFLSEQEKMAFLDHQSSSFYYLPSLLFARLPVQAKTLNQVFTNELALKGMVLENQQQVLRSVQQSGDSSTMLLYKQWRFDKASIGKQALLLKAKRTGNLDSLEEVTNQLEQQLSGRSTAFRNQQQVQNLTVKNISQKLLKGEAAVEFLRFKLFHKKWTDSILYAAMIVLPEGNTPLFIPLFEEKKLLRLLRPSADTTASTIYRLYPAKNLLIKKKSASDTLYQMVWEPLEKYLKGVHTIYYAPAGLLHRIAFQALRPDAGHLLIDKYQLNQLLSTRSVAVPLQTTPKTASAGIWGNIDYNLQAGDKVAAITQHNPDTTVDFFNLYTDDTRGSRNAIWSALPGTKKEMDSIGIVFQQAGVHIQGNSGALASEETFKALDGNSPQVLHIATHGFFLPVAKANTGRKFITDPANNVFTVQQNPMFRSGLVLAGANHAWKGNAALPGREDGILTAYEIAQMDLSHTDLVVLSACETALGDLQGNEGVIGLQRAFKMAGVKQMILSLWRVPDKETVELMTLFYKSWLGGQSIREALHEAQLKMRKKYSPYYWAGFVLVE